MEKVATVREYLLEQINDDSDCVYISCTETEEKFQNWMESAGVSRNQINSSLHFINPYIRRNAGDNSSQLPWIVSEIKGITDNPHAPNGRIPSIDTDKQWNQTKNRTGRKKETSP